MGIHPTVERIIQTIRESYDMSVPEPSRPKITKEGWRYYVSHPDKRVGEAARKHPDFPPELK